MTVSFAKLYENMALAKAGADSSISDQGTEVVRAGLNIGEDFWDNFFRLIGNSEGVANLLDVPREKVTSWQSKIKEVLDKINQNDSPEDQSDRNKTLPTGQLDLAPPEGATDQSSPDLRPTP